MDGGSMSGGVEGRGVGRGGGGDSGGGGDGGDDGDGRDGDDGGGGACGGLMHQGRDRSQGTRNELEIRGRGGGGE